MTEDLGYGGRVNLVFSRFFLGDLLVGVSPNLPPKEFYNYKALDEYFIY